MAVQAELRSLDCTDIPDADWEGWRPDDPETFGVEVTAGVGPAGAEGCEWFSFWVCTPGWVAVEERLPKDFAFSRYLLIRRWDSVLVERAIGDLIRRTRGDSWTEVAAKLSRYAKWEFEDYKP